MVIRFKKGVEVIIRMEVRCGKYYRLKIDIEVCKIVIENSYLLR